MAAAIVSAAFIACVPTEEDPKLNVRVSPREIANDGTSTTVTVTAVDASGNPGAGSVTLTAVAGSFANPSVSLATGEGETTFTCDAMADAKCTGTIRITAEWEGVTAVSSVVVRGPVTENPDAGGCPDGGACGCPGGAVEDCSDGVDNNCDGKTDCADPTCSGKSCVLVTGLNGVCAQNACACPNKPEVCNDGIDNDCDGNVDCADSDCQPIGNDFGKVCDAAGNTCAPVIEGVSTCSVCAGNGKDPQKDGEVSCGDGADNDCDGAADCQDPDCAASSCSITGKLCDAQKRCECPGGQTETTCDDFVDNDCDGKTDCADTDCYATGTTKKSCKLPNVPSAGNVCDTAGKCVCSGNGGATETKEGATTGQPTCGDGFDNDCDGLADCADPDCRPTTSTGNGKDCSQPNGMPVTIGMTCDAAGTCVCSGNGGARETKESTCNDAKDNDCDGKVDCADPDCAGLTCGANGRACGANGCGCPTGTAELCNDFKDNNCDGIIDCADTLNCPVGTQCNASASYQCTASKECKDVNSTMSLTLTATPAKIAANGTATSVISATLKHDTTGPVPGVEVFFAVTTGTGTVTTSAITNGQGVATATYTAGTGGGQNTVTATYQTVSGSTVVDTPALGQVQLTTQQHQIMGVRYSSYNETNEITFKLVDSAGQTYPPGVQVQFTHQPVGGSFIGITPNCTATACTATAVSDGAGLVKVTLHSGTVASVVSVTATATAGGVTGSASASNIAIVGAKPAGGKVSISCTPKNVPGLVDHDCLNSKVNATITCNAAFADRFNNILGVQTVATFKTEAAASNATSQTDPKTGMAKVSVSVLGYSLPVDVAPIPGEHSLEYDSGCGTKIHNPRDGLVSMIVVANGEEGFIDGSNGQPADGVYNLGENFIDVAEPFVDSNDNGTRDNNEDYVDSNNNGVWDGPNGVWDANTRIWAETRVLYTGRATILADAATGGYASSRFFVGAAPPTSGPTLPPAVSVFCGMSPTTQNVGVYFADKNFNVLTPATTFSVGTISGQVASKYTLTPNQVDTLGMNFSQQFCSSQTGGTCSTTCQNAPCYVVSSVNSFVNGNYGTVEVKGGTQFSNPNEVRATSTYGGVSTHLSIYPECQ